MSLLLIQEMALITLIYLLKIRQMKENALASYPTFSTEITFTFNVMNLCFKRKQRLIQ